MKKSVDFIGVGTGPFNLSIAALSHQIEELDCLFFDEHPHFSWHPGMLVPDCHMQTVFLKDLVSAVAPTNPYSFVNYLVKHKKFYRFLTSRLRTVSREEFSDYLRWAAEDMNNLYFSHTVENIDFDKKRRLFLVQTSQGEYFARNICLGTGKQPYLPPCVKHMTQSCFHASEMNLRRPDLSGKRITVVGGGQSGADLFLNALRGEWGEAAEINWVSRRNNFNALDEAAFADEYFTPEYISGFSGLEEDIRHQLLDEQKMTSDGITADSLLTIYRELYHRFEVLRKPRNIRLLPSRSVTTLESSGPGWKLLMEHHLDQGRESLESDVVIFATGYRSALPQILPSLMPLITMHDKDTLWPVFESNRWLLNDVCRLAVENLLYAARKRGLEPGIFCAIHTYGRRLNWHPHVHVSVTCGGLNKHGQWKKLSFLKDAMRSRWMWNMRQLLLKAWSEGMAMPESLSHITTESQWRSLVLKSGGKYWHVYMSKKTAGGRNTARYLGRYLKKPPIAASRLAHYNGGASLSFRYLDHKTGETATETLTQRELVARLKQHIPEKFFKMVRYFGFLANRVCGEKLPQVYRALGMDKPEPVAKVCYAQMVKQFLSRDPFECVLCGCRMVYRRAIAGLNVSGLKKNARDISLLRYMPA